MSDLNDPLGAPSSNESVDPGTDDIELDNEQTEKQTLEKDEIINPDPDDVNFVNVEFLDQKSPSFEDKTHQALKTQTSHDVKTPKGSSDAIIAPSSSRMNITINLSEEEFKKAQFHFTGVLFVRSFKTQHLADPVCLTNIFGSSMSDLTE